MGVHAGLLGGTRQPETSAEAPLGSTPSPWANSRNLEEAKSWASLSSSNAKEPCGAPGAQVTPRGLDWGIDWLESSQSTGHFSARSRYCAWSQDIFPPAVFNYTWGFPRQGLFSKDPAPKIRPIGCRSPQRTQGRRRDVLGSLKP